MLYRTLKQILGFDAGEVALFQRVVLVRDDSTSSLEIGLVTASEVDGEAKHLTVFQDFPGSPNPSPVPHCGQPGRANRVQRGQGVEVALLRGEYLIAARF